MSCLIFRLSRRQRFGLALTFTILNLIQVLLGICTAGWSIYICVSISHNLYSEKAEITFVFTVTCMYGSHVIIHYLVGIKISQKCFNRAHKRSTKKHLTFWSLAGCNVIINIFVVAIMATAMSKHIIQAMRHSLEKGMRQYLKDAEWKQMIDSMQVDFECCGINSYRDWHNTSWITNYQLNTDATFVKSLRLTKDLLHYPITPWSCCRVDFPMQCLHDPFQQIQSAHLWLEQPDFVLESINQEGCLEVVRAPIESSLFAFTVVGTLIITLQALIVIVSRLVYTSCRNAVVLRDPYGDSPGWIFFRNVCSTSPDRTLSSMMMHLSNDRRQPLHEDAEGIPLTTVPQTVETNQTLTTGLSSPVVEDVENPYTEESIAVNRFATSTTNSPFTPNRFESPIKLMRVERVRSAHRRPSPTAQPVRHYKRRGVSRYRVIDDERLPPLMRTYRDYRDYHAMPNSARDSDRDQVSSAEEDALMLAK